MAGDERHLHLVPPGPAERGPASSELEDLGLTAAIFLVAALPLVSAITGHGRWSDGSLGLGALGVLLAGRELCGWLVARWRSARRP